MNAFILFLCVLVVMTAAGVRGKQYTCQKCISEGKNCVGTEKVQNCDYCAKIDGKIYNVKKVPDMAKQYLKDNHPRFKLRNNQHIVVRGCISKQLLKTLGLEDAADCVKITKNEKIGFVGHFCTCLGNC